jgi:hypothetical protein
MVGKQGHLGLRRRGGRALAKPCACRDDTQ